MIRRLFLLISERKIVTNLTTRNLKVKYIGTWLGFLWVFVQPLCTISILYFVFSHVIQLNIQKFPLFLCAGVLPWTFFSSALIEATSSVVNNSNLVLKVNFPLEAIPLSYCFSNLIDFIFSLIILIPILFYFHITIPPSAIWYVLPIIIFHLCFTIGLSLMLSVAHVYFKDIGHLLAVFLMFWFYLTPIFYTIDHLPENIIALYQYNPMLHFVEAYRAILFHSVPPEGATLGILACIGVITLVIGWIIFIANERTMVKEL